MLLQLSISRALASLLPAILLGFAILTTGSTNTALSSSLYARRDCIGAVAHQMRHLAQLLLLDLPSLAV